VGGRHPHLLGHGAKGLELLELTRLDLLLGTVIVTGWLLRWRGPVIQGRANHCACS
jgi:hypothetical protein